MMQNSICKRALRMLDHAGIVLTEQETLKMEVADFGLGEVERQGLELIAVSISLKNLSSEFQKHKKCVADAPCKIFSKIDISQQAAFRLDCALSGSAERFFVKTIDSRMSLTQINSELRLKRTWTRFHARFEHPSDVAGCRRMLNRFSRATPFTSK